MKHYFIDNPVSGKNNPVNVIQELVIPAAEKAHIDWTVYVTKYPGDGERYVREVLKNGSGEPVRFYAVGGDGTLFEVVNGAYGYPNAEITCIPKGSGNDYIRLYGGREEFLCVPHLIAGRAVQADGLRIELDHETVLFAINQASMGFDAEACAYQGMMKKLPGAIGHMTYMLAGLYCMFTRTYNTFACTIDGQRIHGPFFLAAACNSKWYGSGIPVAPFADPFDGYLDCVVIRRTQWWPSIFKCGIADWQVKGTHVNHSYCLYIRGKQMNCAAEKPVSVNIDGEVRKVRHMVIQAVPKAFRFVVPSTFDPEKVSRKIDQGLWHEDPYMRFAEAMRPYDWFVNRLCMGYGRRRY